MKNGLPATAINSAFNAFGDLAPYLLKAARITVGIKVETIDGKTVSQFVKLFATSGKHVSKLKIR